MTLPAWNSSGVLPPFPPGSIPTGPERSPYPVDLATLQDRFTTTPERETVFKGFLKFRAALHAAGIVQGFQWVDGSFTEDIERLENRAPRDVDVVTFFYLPAGTTQEDLLNRHGTLFDRGLLKQVYSVDAFFVVLGEKMVPEDVSRIAYWYGLWSHRRDGMWKGFVQVDLDPAQHAMLSDNVMQQASRSTQ